MGNLSKRFVFLLIALHLAIAVPLAYVLNVWVDEASTLYNTENGFIHTFQTVFTTEKQAPLYFLLLSVWRDIDGSVFFARLFSLIWSCLAIKVFFDLSRRNFSENQAFLITSFFALHPFLFWISLEIRLYTMIVLFSCLLLNHFQLGYLNDEKRSRLYFVLSAITGLYINYYMGFLLLGGFLALLILRRNKAAKSYFLHMIIVGLAILPLALIIKMQLEINTGGHKEITDLVVGMKMLWGHLLTFVIPTELMPGDEQTVVSMARIWLIRLSVLAGIVLLIKSRFRAIDEKVIVFGTFSAVVLAMLLFAFSILGGEYIALRHASVLFVPVVLAAASIYSNLLPQKVWIALAVFFTFLFSYSIYTSFPTFAKRGDWRHISQYIEQREKPNQPIVTSQAYDAISIPYHYKGINRVVPDDRFFEWDIEDSKSTENAFRKQTEFIISEIPADAEGIWLLTRDTCHLPETAPSCRPLEKYVEENYTVEIEKDFYLEKLRLLKKK